MTEDGRAGPRPARAEALREGNPGRWLSDRIAEPDSALAAEGWERRFVTDGARAVEVVALYGDLGYEVRLEPVRPSEIPEGCSDCQLVLLLHFKTVYTRKRLSIRDDA